MNRLAPFLILATLCGCAYPTSSIVQGADSSGIFVVSAPLAAHLFVDGRDVGEAASFDGKKSFFAVDPGQHRVAVQGSGGSLYDRTVYVGVGSRVSIKVN